MRELKEIRNRALSNAKEVIEQNKELVEQAYHYIMSWSHIARYEGFLGLDVAIESMPKEMFLVEDVTELVRMVTDGTDPEYISELATVKFIANDYRGIEAFLYYLYVRSILMIQSGMPSYEIEMFINMAIPEKNLHFNEQRKIKSEEEEEKLKELKADLSDVEKAALQKFTDSLLTLSAEEWKIVVGRSGFVGWELLLPLLEKEVQEQVAVYMNPYRYRGLYGNPTSFSEDKLLELVYEAERFLYIMRNPTIHVSILEPILEYSDGEIQRFMRDIDNVTLAVALKGEREEIVNVFTRNLSVRLKYMLLENMEYMGPVRMCDVEEAQRKVMCVIERIVAKEKGEVLC